MWKITLHLDEDSRLACVMTPCNQHCINTVGSNPQRDKNHLAEATSRMSSPLCVVFATEYMLYLFKY